MDALPAEGILHDPPTVSRDRPPQITESLLGESGRAHQVIEVLELSRLSSKLEDAVVVVPHRGSHPAVYLHQSPEGTQSTTGRVLPDRAIKAWSAACLYPGDERCPDRREGRPPRTARDHVGGSGVEDGLKETGRPASNSSAAGGPRSALPSKTLAAVSGARDGIPRPLRTRSGHRRVLPARVLLIPRAEVRQYHDSPVASLVHR